MEDGNVTGKVSESKSGEQAEPRTGNRGNQSRSGERVEGAGLHRRILSTKEGRDLGGKRHEEATDILKGNAGADVHAQQKILIDWAKGKGYLYDKDDYKELQKSWKKDENGELVRIGGIESDVFPDFVNKQVTKVVKDTRQFNFDAKPIDYLNDRITYHNKYFPQTAYKLLGIMDYNVKFPDSQFSFVIDQPFVIGETPTEEEIDKKLREIGFQTDAHSYFIKEEDGTYMRLGDTHQGNFIKDKDGNIISIDSVFEVVDADDIGRVLSRKEVLDRRKRRKSKIKNNNV